MQTGIKQWHGGRGARAPSQRREKMGAPKAPNVLTLFSPGGAIMAPPIKLFLIES